MLQRDYLPVKNATILSKLNVSLTCITSLKWSIADLLTSSHPQMSASHLLGLQVRANGPSLYVQSASKRFNSKKNWTIILQENMNREIVKTARIVENSVLDWKYILKFVVLNLVKGLLKILIKKKHRVAYAIS